MEREREEEEEREREGELGEGGGRGEGEGEENVERERREEMERGRNTGRGGGGCLERVERAGEEEVVVLFLCVCLTCTVRTGTRNTSSLPSPSLYLPSCFPSFPFSLSSLPPSLSPPLLGSDSDEARFRRRKSRSMKKARLQCLPMNFDPQDSAQPVIRDRQRIGASLADVDPMAINRDVTFDSIGGLKHHIRSLKEMILFPLLYPEVFDRFKIQPPRGVLFYGPPGCGKTLVARALANECSKGGKKVAFFMRKGADCLSKWVGESERQLRLLFDEVREREGK